MVHRHNATHLENRCNWPHHNAAAFDLREERLYVVETYLAKLDAPVCAMLTKFFEAALIAVPGLGCLAIQP